jgi:hypothetical protein
MKNIVFYFLIVNFLWSTSGIGLIGHFCGGEMKFGSLYGLSEQTTCHEEAAPREEAKPGHACCAMEAQHEAPTCQPHEKGCCEDEVRFLKVAEEFLIVDGPVRALQFDSQLTWEHAQPELPAQLPSEVYPPEFVEPPPLYAAPRVLYQQFLL